MPTISARDSWLADVPRPMTAPGLRRWLVERGSLTARLRARCCRFRVELVRQRLTRVHRDEAALLGLAAGRIAWLREVLLITDGVPVVYARSILPTANLRGAWRLVTDMGERPLGAALFADPRIVRCPLHFARLDRRDPRHRRTARLVPNGAKCLWARRSVFLLKGRALLVSEVFLPDLSGLPE